MSNITQERVRELFEYRDGALYWKVRSAKRVQIGERAGGDGTDSSGYRMVRVDGRRCKEHRIIYLFHHGDLPELLDHIDNDRSNNRIENLRPCTRQENGRNRRIGKDNTSGVKGVSWQAFYKKWWAQLAINRKVINVGLFDDIAEAAIAIRDARNKYHGEFARHE